MLPADFPQGANTYGDAVSLDARLSVAETERLVRDANHAYGTSTDELLLTALVRAVQRWNGATQMLVSLEGHGREALEDLDISRTVGWFTNEYPVLLELPDTPEPGYQIKTIKETLRNVPHKGTGYGILAYAVGYAELTGLQASLSFNYLGEFNGTGGELFALSEVPDSASVNPKLARSTPLALECLVLGAEFSFSLQYSRLQYRRETVETLMALFQEELDRIVGFCAGRKEAELTPADLTYSNLTLEELDDLFT